MNQIKVQFLPDLNSFQMKIANDFFNSWNIFCCLGDNPDFLAIQDVPSIYPFRLSFPFFEEIFQKRIDLFSSEDRNLRGELL